MKKHTFKKNMTHEEWEVEMDKYLNELINHLTFHDHLVRDTHYSRICSSMNHVNGLCSLCTPDQGTAYKNIAKYNRVSVKEVTEELGYY